MSVLVHKAIGANAEEISVEWDATLNAYVIKSQKAGTGSSYPVIIRREETGGIQVDTSTLEPVTDNQTDLGTPTKRFKTGYVATDFTVGDLVFQNGFRFTEPDKVYEHADPSEGIYLLNDKGHPVAFFSKDGILTVRATTIIDNFPHPTVPREEEKKPAPKKATRKKKS